MWTVSAIKLALIAFIQFFEKMGPLILTCAQYIASGIKFIFDFFALKTKRLQEQVDEEHRVKKLMIDTQNLKESQNIKAWEKVMDKSWEIRYNQINKFIEEGKYDEVLVLIDAIDVEEVNAILFNTELSPKYRAVKIIQRMRTQLPK